MTDVLKGKILIYKKLLGRNVSVVKKIIYLCNQLYNLYIL